MTNDGLSYWQAETSGEPLLETTIGDCLREQFIKVLGLEEAAQIKTA